MSISRYDEVKNLILSVMYELIRLLSACLRTFDNFNDISLSGYLSPLFFPNSFFSKEIMHSNAEILILDLSIDLP